MRLPALATLVLVAGCRAPAPRPVWVTLPEPPPSAAPPAAPLTAPAPMTPLVVGLKALAPGRLRAAPVGTTRQIAAKIVAAQEEARERLRRQLRQYLEREVRVRSRELDIQLQKDGLAFSAAVSLRLRTAFERYADARAPILVDLALLTGWPDPGPDPSPEATRAARDREVKANALREELKRLDALFEAEATALANEERSAGDAARAAALVEVEKLRTKLQAEADAEAARQVRVEVAALPIRLLRGGPANRLPAVPPVTLRLPGSSPAPVLPAVPTGDAEARVAEREATRAELRIFLARRNYVLRRGAPDATAEFTAWRRDIDR